MIIAHLVILSHVSCYIHRNSADYSKSENINSVSDLTTAEQPLISNNQPSTSSHSSLKPIKDSVLAYLNSKAANGTIQYIQYDSDKSHVSLSKSKTNAVFLLNPIEDGDTVFDKFGNFLSCDTEYGNCAFYPSESNLAKAFFVSRVNSVFSIQQEIRMGDMPFEVGCVNLFLSTLSIADGYYDPCLIVF